MIEILAFFFVCNWWISPESEEGYNRLTLGREIILNICMFIPIGFFAAGLFSTVKKRILIAVLVGVFLSVLVEVLQLYLGRGLFEFDDIFNNAIGSAVGGAAYMILLQPGGSLKSGTE